MKETRIINWNDLRNLCIKNDWYTRGNNEEYANMLDYATSNDLNTARMMVVAEDIIIHSNPARFVDCGANGTTPMQYVMFELAEISHTFFHESESDFAKGNKYGLNKINSKGKHERREVAI